MSLSTSTTLVHLAVGALLLAAVLIVWRHELAALVRLLAWQGASLAAIPIVTGIRIGDPQLVAVGIAVLGLRAGAFPWLLRRLLRGGQDARETEPVVNTSASLLIVALLTVFAFGVSRPLIALDPSPGVQASPVALAVILIAMFVLVTRRHALTQVVGFLVLDNGIAAMAFLTTRGVPLIIELGVSLDVLLAVLVLQVLTGRMRIKFGGTDLGELRELRE